MTNIIDNMLSLCPVSEDTIQELKKCMILCRFPKKYQLIKENTFCKSAYFIEKGMTRSFWLVNGEEITTSFSWEGGIVFSMDELYYNKPSEEFVETLEDVVVYKISLVDLTKLSHWLSCTPLYLKVHPRHIQFHLQPNDNHARVLSMLPT